MKSIRKLFRWKMLVFLGLLYVQLGCKSDGNKHTVQSDTPVRGNIKIAADVSLKELVENLLFVFENTYLDASLECIYLSENKLSQQLMQDSFRMMIIHRPLNDQELNYFRQANVRPIQELIASDALAIITYSQQDTLLTKNQLITTLSTDTGVFRQFVFEKKNTSTLTTILAMMNLNNQIPNHFYGMDSIAIIIDYLYKNKQAAALIPAILLENEPFISNTEIKVIGIYSHTNRNQDIVSYPFQAYMSDSSYPLVRGIYTVTAEGRSGLGTGFASFIASDVGQRIVLRLGLLPATMPQRTVEIRNSIPLTPLELENKNKKKSQ